MTRRGTGPSPGPDRTLVLVTSPDSRRAARGLPQARAALRDRGLAVPVELPVSQVSRLSELVGGLAGAPPLVVAAGGHGTVGAVARHLAGTQAVLGVLPLGTSNDFARSLGIAMRTDQAVDLFRSGKVSTIDLERLEMPGRDPLHFVHATVDVNVNFARLATRAPVRKRLRRLTYVVAATLALRERRCEISYQGRSERWHLTHLSVIKTPRSSEGSWACA